MSLLGVYAKVSILSVLRNKSAFYFGIVFPVILYLMFGRYGVTSQFDKMGSLVVFCNYAVQTVFFLSLGMQISNRRSSEWTIYLRTLPASPFHSMFGMIIEKFISALIALLLIVVVNNLIFGQLMSGSMTLYMIIAAMLGGIPMAFLGIAFGYRLHPDSARSVFVFVNLAFLFAAFAIPEQGGWNIINIILPVHHWARIVMSHYEAGDAQVLPWFWMLGFGVLFAGLALWSYRTRKDLRRA